MTQEAGADWDPRDSSILEDQRSGYDRMREQCPVAHSNFLDWSVFRHEDIMRILDDVETFSSETRRHHVPNGMDPPQHTSFRQALEPFFSTDYVSSLEPASRQIASAILSEHAVPGECEFMEDFAHPYTLKSLCAFVGWPQENWQFLRGWTHGNQEAAFSRNREVGAALAHGYANYVQRGLDARRKNTDADYIERDLAERRRQGGEPRTDLISSLMRLEVNGELLTDEQIVSATRNWTAGHGTVAAAIGNIAHALAIDPSLQRQLRDDPSLIPNAIDEIPRTNGPLVANRRTTTRDVTVNDRTVPKGSKTSLMWIAANRDPRVFEDADEINLERDQSQNLLYGHGVHYCLGVTISRLELRIAIEELLQRTTEFTLASNADLEPQVYPANGFQELPLRLT